MINNQNCFALNFGYNGEIPIRTVSFQIAVQQKLEHHEFEKSYKCFFVFVGGKYVETMKTVVDKVEDISKQFHGIHPIAMFVMGKFSSLEIKKLSHIGHKFTKVRQKILTFIDNGV